MTRARRPVVDPTLALEHRLAADRAPDGTCVLVGLDEVGRGALAGPVAVGACAILAEDGRIRTRLPAGVRDSKALSPLRREALDPQIRESAHATAVGWAEAAEIDAIGIMGALREAAVRALEGLGIRLDVVLLDGDVDVIDERAARLGAPRVHLRVGADRDCLSVAAASVIAKVARDERMRGLDEIAPAYGWAGNKGYASAAHREALRAHGAHAQHRRSWNLGLVPSGAGRAPRMPSPDRGGPQPDVLWGAEREGRPRTGGEDAP